MSDVLQSGIGIKNSGTYWNIWGISLFGRGEEEVLTLVEESFASDKKNYWIATVNPEFVMAALKDSDFKALLSRTHLNVVDGIGLVWARRVLMNKTVFGRLMVGFGTGIEALRGGLKSELASGADLMDRMCAMAERLGKTVYFLGGWNDRSKRTAEFFGNRYPRLKVAGYYGGKRVGEDEIILKQLQGKQIDFLFVAYHMKNQEEWIDRNLKKLNVGVVMGVGRCFDYYSGDLKRAPGWISRIGLEWLYSLIREPSRWRRQLALPRFVWKVLTG